MTRLAEITARAQAATKGPWETGAYFDAVIVNDGSKYRGNNPPVGKCCYCHLGEPIAVHKAEDGSTKHTHRIEMRRFSEDEPYRVESRAEVKYVADFGSEADAVFAAHAREDIPWLLARVEELERLLNAI
jgi:hypothetical protein